MSSSSEVVQRFFDAVISRDVESIPGYFSSDAVFTMDGVGVVGTGRDAIKRVYTAMFEEHPGVHVELVQRLAIGRVVVDHESVAGFDSAEAADWVWVYTVQGDLITTMHGIRA